MTALVRYSGVPKPRVCRYGQQERRSLSISVSGFDMCLDRTDGVVRESESVIVREGAHWNDGKCNAATNGWNYSVMIGDSQAHDTAKNQLALNGSRCSSLAISYRVYRLQFGVY